MKITKKVLISSMAAALLAFSSCADNGGEENKSTTNTSSQAGSGDNNSTSSSSTSVTLPKSVGVNPFVGKTFTDTESWDNDKASSTKTWEFSENSAVKREVNVKKTDEHYDITPGERIYTYTYSYDAEKAVLYLSLESQEQIASGTNLTISKPLFESDPEAYLTSLGCPAEQLEYNVLRYKAEFSAVKAYGYSIDTGKITLTDYFTGSLPSNVSFSYYYDSGYYNNYNYSDHKISTTVRLSKRGEIELDYREYYNISSYYEVKSEWIFYPTFSNGTFTGPVFLQEHDTESKKSSLTKIGTASGTYTTSGTGTSGCTVTLKFTELPDSVIGITTGTEYTLEQ